MFLLLTYIIFWSVVGAATSLDDSVLFLFQKHEVPESNYFDLWGHLTWKEGSNERAVMKLLHLFDDYFHVLLSPHLDSYLHTKLGEVKMLGVVLDCRVYFDIGV